MWFNTNVNCHSFIWIVFKLILCISCQSLEPWCLSFCLLNNLSWQYICLLIFMLRINTISKTDIQHSWVLTTKMTYGTMIWQKKKKHRIVPQFAFWILYVILFLLKSPAVHSSVKCISLHSMLAKWCELPSHFISMTIFYWQSDNFPLRHWHLTTIATFQHFQLSLHWLTPLNICSTCSVLFFFLDDISTFRASQTSQ